DEHALAALDLDSPGPAALQMMAFHPLGTCGAGRVADWDQRAGPGVMIADGSVVPESLGVNPQVTIAAFGLRAAETLLGAAA
ncbi:MAG: GMC oxidoreductase, partial [Elusimicrobia bacterium]|nr:GMC oxidoreductase [Elusimicrobiota bacterium]